MDIQNAIKHLDDILSKKDKWIGCEDCKQEHVQLMEWLKELQQYRSFGTVEKFEWLKEQSTPKKPYIQSDGNKDSEQDCFECPNCDSFLGYVSDCKDDENYQCNYCPNCGQKILWEDEDER